MFVSPACGMLCLNKCTKRLFVGVLLMTTRSPLTPLLCLSLSIDRLHLCSEIIWLKSKYNHILLQKQLSGGRPLDTIMKGWDNFFHPFYMQSVFWLTYKHFEEYEAWKVWGLKEKKKKVNPLQLATKGLKKLNKPFLHLFLIINDSN